jgi:glycoside/pentoside/hexuronide:cation symporter, GPH family
MALDAGAASPSRAVIFAYALPALPLAMLVLPVYIYVPAYYADTLGLGFGGVGLVLLLARLWDMVTDPAIGWLSDRAGGRKRWVIAGLPLTMIAAWLLLMPPLGVGLAYLLAAAVALYLGWTMMMVPLNAWGAELASDYDTRTRIAGWREALALVGTVLAMAMPEIANRVMASTDQVGTLALPVLAVAIMLLLPLAVVFMAVLVPDVRPSPAPSARPNGLRTANALVTVWHNRPFRRLITAYFLNGVANGLPATLFLLFVEHRIGRPDAAGWLLLTYFFCGLAAVPVWMHLAKRFEKHHIWCVAMLATCAAFAAAPFLPVGQAWPFAVMSALTGLALGADLALPPAMQADVIDVDRLQTGRERAGFYMALWGMSTKMALALAVGIAFPLLALAGFAAVPSPVAEAAQGLWALTGLYAVAPILFKLAAVALMWRYPLTRLEQGRLRDALAHNRERIGQDDTTARFLANLDAHHPVPGSV